MEVVRWIKIIKQMIQIKALTFLFNSINYLNVCQLSIQNIAMVVLVDKADVDDKVLDVAKMVVVDAMVV